MVKAETVISYLKQGGLTVLAKPPCQGGNYKECILFIPN